MKGNEVEAQFWRQSRMLKATKGKLKQIKKPLFVLCHKTLAWLSLVVYVAYSSILELNDFGQYYNLKKMTLNIFCAFAVRT